MPQISCVMPIFNGVIYLEEAIQSILGQSFSDFELLLIDDCSTDHSVAVMEKMSQLDSRIRILKNEVNLGLPATINLGIRNSKGEFVARMDQDDISEPTRFQKQFDFLRSHAEIDIVGSWWEYFPKSIVLKMPTDHCGIKMYSVLNNPMGHPTVLFRKKEVIEKVGFYDVTAFPVEDYEFWCRGLDRVQFANIGEVLLKYRIHEAQSSNQKSDKQQLLSKNLRIGQIKKILAVDFIAKKFIDLLDHPQKSNLSLFMALSVLFFINLVRGIYCRKTLAKFFINVLRGHRYV